MSNITTIVRQLSVLEQQQLQNELTQYSWWTPHVLNNEFPTALQDGRSIHINSVIDGKHVATLLDKFSLTHEIMKSVAKERVIARSYWHKLECNDTIPAHTDSTLYDVIHDRLDNRYQIYLDCPDVDMIVDGQTVNAKTFENSVVSLDLTQPHGYVNNSITPWIFLVFDVLKPDVKLN